MILAVLSTESSTSKITMDELAAQPAGSPKILDQPPM